MAPLPQGAAATKCRASFVVRDVTGVFNLQADSWWEKRTCTDSSAHRACSFNLRHEKFLADPAAMNSAQETLMKTSVCLDPFSGSVQKQESQ